MAKCGIRFGYEPFISRKYSLEQANQALADVAAAKVIKAVIKP
ncbi:MAG: hypothetical protein ACUVWZ_15300 [Anaerolineae bacterium]